MKITNTWVFRLSILSALLLFATIAYGQKLFRDFWLLHAFVQLIIILFFAVITSWGIVFWAKKGDEVKAPYLPLLINFLMAVLIVILPLNWIRNRIEFTTNVEQFDHAVTVISSEKPKTGGRPQIYQLPPDLEYLSLDGVVMVINKPEGRGIFFFTFRGAPKGVAGFLKITGQGKIDDFTKPITAEKIAVTKDLRNNWYYISTE